MECSLVAKLELGQDSESATKSEPTADLESSSNLELDSEPTYEPPFEPKYTTDSKSPDERESRADDSDDLNRAQNNGC